MISKLQKTAVYILCVTLLCGAGGFASAANIYVNDSQSVLGTDIGTAYVIGGDGSVVVAADTYVITGSGVQKLGTTSTTPGGAPEIPSGESDGTTVSTKYKTVRVGLKYASSALSSANLQNEVGWGYQFGYYDSDRVFHSTGSTNENKITMTPTGSGREVTVTVTGTDTVLYVHDGSSAYNLAVHPLSDGASAETWFKGYTYFGDFEYFRYDSKGLTVINVVSIDDYVKCVVPYEMSPSWPIEALKAQAVCARSYFAANVNSSYAKYGFDVTATTSSQAYSGTGGTSANSNAAVEATAGEYLTYDGKICNAVYSSSSGGGTENSENVFYSALGYLRGVPDPFHDEVPSSMNSYKEWHRELTGEQLAAKTGNAIGAVTSVEPTYSATGNVIALKLSDANGRSYTFTKDECRTKMGMPSIHYTIEPSTSSYGTFVIDGGGWGHNVGMSQFGAYAMAKNHGYNYRQILRYYYTGVSISKAV